MSLLVGDGRRGSRRSQVVVRVVLTRGRGMDVCVGGERAAPGNGVFRERQQRAGRLGKMTRRFYTRRFYVSRRARERSEARGWLARFLVARLDRERDATA